MAAIRQILEQLGRWGAGASFVAAVIGLPITVAVLQPTEDHGALANKPRNAVIIAAPARIGPHLNLTMTGGVLHTGDGTPFASDRPIRRIEAESASFALDFASARAGAFEPPLASTELARVLAQLAEMKVGTLVLKRATLDVVASESARLRLTHIDGEFRSAGRDSFTANGTARLSGQPIAFEATWSRRDTAHPLRLTIKGSLIDLRFDGRISLADGPSLEGFAELSTRKARALARLFGLPVQSAADLRNSRVSGDMTWARGLLAFPKAAVVMDGNEASGVLSVRTQGPRPKFEGTLAFNTLSLEPYLESLQNGLGKTESGDKPGALQPLIATVDADIRISAGKIVAPMLELGRAAVTVSIKDARMRADLAEIAVEGGTVDGIVNLDVSAPLPRLSLKLRATSIDPGRVFSNALQRNPLIGRVNMTIDVTGTGHTLPELGATLTGKGSVQLVESGRLGIDLKALASVVQKTEATGWAAAGRGTTSLSSLDARYLMSGGQIEFESIVAQSGTMTYFGAGRVDIANKFLDLKLAHASATASEVPVTLRDALRIHGAWSTPRFDQLPSPFRLQSPVQRSQLFNDVPGELTSVSGSASRRGRTATTPP